MNFNHILNHIQDLDSQGDFLELGTGWGEDSTDILAQLADQLQRQLYTIDFDPDCTSRASERHKHKSWVHCVNARAEHWLQQHQHLRFSLVLLDNYDWINQPDLPQQPQWQQQQTQRYQQLGEQQQNLISQARHLQQLQLVLPLLTDRAVIVLDDTHWRERDHDYTGKGSACVPLLLDHGFELHHYNHGVIMQRGSTAAVPSDRTTLTFGMVAPHGLDSITERMFENKATVHILALSQLEPTQQFVYCLNTNLTNLGQFTAELTVTDHAAHLFDQDRIPSVVLNMLRQGPAKVLINHATEAVLDPVLLDQISQYAEHMSVPLHNIIYVSNAHDGDDIIDTYTQQTHRSSRIQHFFYPYFRFDHRTYYHRDWTRDPRPSVPIKLFLCFNYKHHDHRVLFYLMMQRHNLIKHCYYSLPQHSYRGSFLEAVSTSIHAHPEFAHEFTDSEISQADQNLPLVLEPNFQQHMQDRSSMAPELYKHSMISVVVETNFFRPGIHITEKTYKPISFRHAFVLVAGPGHVKVLQQMGFETFGDFWDEGYDLIQDHKQRMQAVISVLEHISRWSENQQRDFKDQVEVRLVKNQKLLETLSRDTGIIQQFIQRHSV